MLSRTEAGRKAGQREGQEDDGPEEMPEGVRALPPKLREAWLTGKLLWSGEKLLDRDPVVKTRPGHRVAKIIARGGAVAIT
jgi:hypothetical protein